MRNDRPLPVMQKPWWHNSQGGGMNPSAARIDHDTGEPGQWPMEWSEEARKCWVGLKREGWVE